jgi:hypothetical protein
LTNPTRGPIRRLGALALVALAVLGALTFAPLPARGATSVEISAHPLVGGRYEAGGWLAVVVSLVNDGAPTEGFVSAESTDGTARRFVELPAGSRKAVTLYVRPQAFARRLDVTFEAPEGSKTIELEVRAIDRASSQVAIVGDGAGNLRPQIVGTDAGALPEPLTLAPGDLPERPEPLSGIAGIVWAADSTSLTEGQRLSLDRWVAAGGQLVVIGGPDWQARTAAFTEILPVEPIAAGQATLESLAALAEWADASAVDGADETVASGPTRDGAVAIIPGTDAGPLVAYRIHGAGRVLYAAVDLATPPYRGWEGAPAFWTRLLPTNVSLEAFFGGPVLGPDEASNAMSVALGNIPSLEVPPAELLLAVIVGYILIIGPISYLVLRRIDRRELAWITAPILVVLFTACSYGIGTTLKGSAIILNEITLIRSAPGGGAATVQTYAGLFSPTRSSYDLTVDADALVAPINSTMFADPVARPASTGTFVVEQGNPAHLRGLSMSVFGFQALRSDAVVEHRPALDVSWSLIGGDVVGTVTNTGDAPMEDVAVVAVYGGRRVGDLGPGESKEFTLSTNNFNGSAAADQVYSFGGFETSSPEQRQVLIRREVINALVGYGGWFPGSGMDFGIGADRGPFVIGWLMQPGPVTISVDGQQVQRHSQTVEVIAARPGIGPGEVTLQPGAIPVSVVSMDGDASSNEPGWVNLGDGEVVFAMTLPLEAASMEVTGLRILTGSDPSMVFAPQGGGGFGFMPAGFTLSVRDPRSGEWVELGNLNAQSTFDVDDPASAISDSGRIEVRVRGDGIDQNFGQMSVFVGARVQGVVAE